MPNLYDWLRHLGWREYSKAPHDRFDRVWYKFFECEPHDYGNPDKPGVQVGLKQWVFPEHISYQLNLTAVCDDDICVELECYGIGENELVEKLDPCVEKLIRAWKACQTEPALRV